MTGQVEEIIRSVALTNPSGSLYLHGHLQNRNIDHTIDSTRALTIL